MISLAVLVALAVLSTSAIMVACLRACEDKDDWILCVGSVGVGYFIFCAPSLGVAEGGAASLAWAASSALGLSVAIFLGSAFRPLRPVWYFGNLMGARMTVEGTDDYEENKTARKENRRYAWATLGLYTLFYFLLLPVLRAAIQLP